MSTQMTNSRFEENLSKSLDRSHRGPRASFIAKLLQSKREELQAAPATLREFRGRIQRLPRASVRFGESSGFAIPADLSDSMMRLTTGMLSSRHLGKANQAQVDQPVSMVREMLMYAYEAKPRPLSFAITGYSTSDFISYIYQDVAMEQMERTDLRDSPFFDAVDVIKDWLREPMNNHTKSPRRHIRRRLMVLLDRTNHQAGSLFEDREVNTDMLYLFFKLLERDEDEGFTRGDIRPFADVRDDFNLLAQFCTYKRYKNDEAKLDAFMRVRCPSLVQDFTTEEIDLPRTRGEGRGSRTKPQGAYKRTYNKAGSRPKTKPEDSEDPFRLIKELS